MLEKQKDLTLLLVIMVALTFGLITGGCDPDDGGGDDDTNTTTTALGGGGNDLTKCIPCDGDFVITCYSSDTGCPDCMTIDMGTGNMQICYDDGSCMETSENGMIYYDKFGMECYSTEFDQATGDVTYIVGNETYIVHEDESWTCSDGSTWVMADDCSKEDTGIPDDGGSNTSDDPQCPPIFELPECE